MRPQSGSVGGRPGFGSREGLPIGAPPGAIGLASRAKAALQGQAVQAQCAAFFENTKNFYVSDRENPYTTPRGKRFLWYRGRQLGGRLHTWSRHVPRMSDHEFKSASLRGQGIDWPISYQDVAPYYDIVERTLGVHGSPSGIPSCPDGQFIGPARTTQAEEKFKTNVEQRIPGMRMTYGRNVRYDRERIPCPSVWPWAPAMSRSVPMPSCVAYWSMNGREKRLVSTTSIASPARLKRFMVGSSCSARRR